MKKTKSECAKLGNIASQITQQAQKKQRIANYNNNPKTCNFCNKSLSYYERYKKFCNRSCAASFNNTGRKRETNYIYIKCPICSEEYLKKAGTNLENGCKKCKEITYDKNPKPCKVCNNSISYKRRYMITCGKSNCISITNGLGTHNRGLSKKGYIGEVHCDSTWEAAFVVYHLDHGKSIKRYDKSISYKYPNTNNIRQYFPDFLVDDKYICEIKGWQSEIDKAKKLAAIKYFGEKYIFYDKKRLEPIFEYIQKQYLITSDDFVKLYEVWCSHPDLNRE